MRLILQNELITDFGPMGKLYQSEYEMDDMIMEIDCSGKMVFPSYCDSHTHLVYAATREQEFVDRIKGLTYEEIADNGGGILNSGKRLQKMSEDDLYFQAMERLEEIMLLGTGAVEIKSGYGLTTESELKMPRVIHRMKQNSPLMIKSTFLAHVFPIGFRSKRDDYMNLLITEMLPQIASEELADHLEYVEDEEIAALMDSETMPTVLPGASFFLNLKLAPVRKMIGAGLPVALASYYNPGSSPSGNMNFVQSLGCLKYGMVPEETIHATTVNSAYAMGISESYGSIAKGKVANLFITKEIPSYAVIPYSFGSNLIETVILNGEIQ